MMESNTINALKLITVQRGYDPRDFSLLACGGGGPIHACTLAKELGVPVLALSQLSRAVEQRDDKKPQLADLRESGSIEQDADVVMFVFREEYYLERKEPKLGTIEHGEWQAKMNEILGTADIIIGKQRHGPTGNVKVEFEGIYTKFKNASKTG